ncbi:DUF4332 domain-containing protein [Thermoproteota archaeon]
MDQNAVIIIGIFIGSTIFVSLSIFFSTRAAEKELSKNKQRIESIPEKSPIETHSDLELLKNISDQHIELLRAENISSIKQLREKIITKQDTNTYSVKLGVYRKYVEEWVRLGEFSRLNGITQDHINLFERVGVKSVRDLSQQTPEVLHRLLIESSDGNWNVLPTLGILSRWIRISRTGVRVSTTS